MNINMGNSYGECYFSSIFIWIEGIFVKVFIKLFLLIVLVFFFLEVFVN